MQHNKGAFAFASAAQYTNVGITYSEKAQHSPSSGNSINFKKKKTRKKDVNAA